MLYLQGDRGLFVVACEEAVLVFLSMAAGCVDVVVRVCGSHKEHRHGLLGQVLGGSCVC